MKRHLFFKHKKYYKEFMQARNHQKIKIKNMTSSGSWVRKYMNTITDYLYECDICKTVLKMPKGSLSNMKRHFERIHPYIHAKETTNLNPDTDGEKEKQQTNQEYLTANNSDSIKTNREFVRRSWIRSYINAVGDGQYECNICKAVLKMPKGLYGNMKRHFEKKHLRIYEKESKKVCSDDEVIQKQHIKSIVQEIVEEDYYDDSTTKDLKLKTDSGNRNVEGHLIENNSLHTSSKKETVEDTTYSNDSDETHYEGNSEKEITLDLDELLDMSDPDIETKIKIWCEKKFAGKCHQNKTCFWNFFKLVSGNVYVCLVCCTTLTIHPENVSNLKRHMKKVHAEAFELIMKYAPKNDSSRRKLTKDIDFVDSGKLQESYVISDFEVVEANSLTTDKNSETNATSAAFKCKTCDAVLTAFDKENFLSDHIKEMHPEKVDFLSEDLPVDQHYNLVIIGGDNA